MFTINGLISAFFITNEIRQSFIEGCDYWKDIFNYFDISGNICIIISAIHISTFKYDHFYANKSESRILIIGLMIVGLRAVTSLRIFE